MNEKNLESSGFSCHQTNSEKTKNLKKNNFFAIQINLYEGHHEQFKLFQFFKGHSDECQSFNYLEKGAILIQSPKF